MARSSQHAAAEQGGRRRDRSGRRGRHAAGEVLASGIDAEQVGDDGVECSCSMVLPADGDGGHGVAQVRRRRPGGVRRGSCRAGRRARCSFTTCASFQPRFAASCMPMFRPCPPAGVESGYAPHRRRAAPRPRPTKCSGLPGHVGEARQRDRVLDAIVGCRRRRSARRRDRRGWARRRCRLWVQ